MTRRLVLLPPLCGSRWGGTRIGRKPREPNAEETAGPLLRSLEYRSCVVRDRDCFVIASEAKQSSCSLPVGRTGLLRR
jgi:hypothetical protein